MKNDSRVRCGVELWAIIDLWTVSTEEKNPSIMKDCVSAKKK